MKETTDDEESEIAKILRHHYGDGLVYLPRHLGKEVYLRAVEKGFIDEAGYMTRKGRILLSQYSYT